MLLPLSNPVPPPSSPHQAEAVRLEAFSYDDRRSVLPGVGRALEGSGGFVLERRTSSPTQIQMRFEVQIRSVMELYSLLIAAGLELTRGSHMALTGLCTLRMHRRRHTEPFGIVLIQLELNFLEELTLADALMPGAATA